MKCATCFAVRNTATDAPFVEQETTIGVAHFCSAECLRKFWNNPDHETLLLRTPEKPSDNPEADKFERRLRQDFAEGHPRVCTVCCDLQELHRQADEAQREKLGTFCGVVRAAEAKYALLATVVGVQVCSVACTRKRLEGESFSAKGFWVSPDRTTCHQCHLLYRSDDFGNAGYGSLILNAQRGADSVGSFPLEGHGGKPFEFCSAQCLLAYLRENPNPPIHWVPKEQVYGEFGPCQCDPHGEKNLPGPFIALNAPFGSILDSGGSGNTYFCSVACLRVALEADAQAMNEREYGPWYREKEQAA